MLWQGLCVLPVHRCGAAAVPWGPQKASLAKQGRRPRHGEDCGVGTEWPHDGRWRSDPHMRGNAGVQTLSKVRGSSSLTAVTT